MEETIVIDGYNLLGAVDRDHGAPLEQRRERLITRLSALATGGHRVILVFDAPAGRESKLSRGALEVVYAPRPGGADSYIEKMSVQLGGRMRVVTSDRDLLDTVLKKGVAHSSPREFWEGWRNPEQDGPDFLPRKRVTIEDRMIAAEQRQRKEKRNKGV